MKSSAMIAFYSIFFAVYFLAFFYIFIRGYQGLALYPKYRPVYTIIITFLAWAYPLSRLLDRTQLFFLHDITYWIGSFWFAVLLYVFLIVVLSDLVRLANLAFHFLPDAKTEIYTKLKFILFAGSTALISILLIVGYINARTPRVKQLEIRVAKKAGNYKELKIVMASDIHMGVLFGKSRMEKMVADMNALKPDIVLFAGDIIDEVLNPVIRTNTGEPLKNLVAPLGIYGITGNHEYIGGINRAVNYIESMGIKLLRDTTLLIDNSFYLAGREDKDIDRFTSKKRKELNEVLEGTNTDLPIILMDHQPFKLDNAEKNGVDLQLSGHTHHGQFWPINLITRKVYEQSWGYKKKGNTHIYVSNGYGFWGPPIRIGNRPEIVCVTITFE